MLLFIFSQGLKWGGREGWKENRKRTPGLAWAEAAADGVWIWGGKVA